MNIDGLKFNFPKKEKPSIEKIEPISPGKNSLEQKNFEENLKKYQENKPDSEEPKQKSPEELRKEKNLADGKGENIDITT